MTFTIVILAVGIFVASLVAFAANMLVPGADSTATEDRLAQMASRRRGGPQAEGESKSLLMDGGFEDAGGFMASITRNMPGLSDYLDQADVRMPPAQFAMICLAAFGGGVVLCLLSPFKLMAVFVGPIFALVPMGWLWMKRRRRLAKFGNQMPEALELLSRSLRAGHSLNAGFGLVSKEMEEPLAREFGRAFEEQNLGIPLEEAIDDMADRVPNMDLRFFATAVVLQRQTGGDLAEILDKIGHLIRERLQILGQIQALTGEGRMSGAVLLALPPVLFLVMLKLNYEYVMMLFNDEIGRYLLGFGLLTQILGAIVIKKIITIKV
ncbi:MAG: type II secretion system F family protein [Planctomycetota bacterium]